MITTTNLLADIRDGKLDASLDEIKDLVRCRQEDIKDAEARKLRYTIKVGDTVYFTNEVRPTYLQGVPAIVRKFNPKKIVIDLLKPAGRFHKGVICPPSMLTDVKP
jgi:hypothetical protein